MFELAPLRIFDPKLRFFLNLLAFCSRWYDFNAKLAFGDMNKETLKFIKPKVLIFLGFGHQDEDLVQISRSLGPS